MSIINPNRIRRVVRELCEEHGHTFILNCVSAALACHLEALQEQIDHIPGKSPNEREEDKGKVWECPDRGCNHTVKLTYDELVECGSPICVNCDTDLELQE